MASGFLNYMGNNPRYAISAGIYIASLTFGFYFVRGSVNLA